MEFENQTTASELSGAVEAGPVEVLPMVVWLRGDEPWYGDFSLDAEAVMQRLGIKRSRLTQISGRELRVGRVRRGRYISPVYRSSDVDEYLAWTRATATHLKASSVLQDAVLQLEDSSERLAERVSHATGTISDTLHDVVAGASSRIITSIQNELNELRRSQADISKLHEQARDSVERQLQLLRQTAIQQAGSLEALTSSLSLVANELRETAALVRILRQDSHDSLIQWQHETQNALSTILAAISPNPTPTCLRPSQLRQLSREKPRVRPAWGLGNGQAGQRFCSGALQADHRQNRGPDVDTKARAGKGARRRPSQLRS